MFEDFAPVLVHFVDVVAEMESGTKDVEDAGTNGFSSSYQGLL